MRTPLACLLLLGLTATGTLQAAERRHAVANFQVYGARNTAERKEIAVRCQTIRDELHERWNGEEPQQQWSPVCEIVLHHRETDYLSAVGAGGRGTLGATYIQFDPKNSRRILRRRVDLLTAGQSDLLAALPHEMTHVLLADRFAGTQPPPWLDEGIATLADPAVKQQRHLSDLRAVTTRGGHQSIAHMLNHEGPIPSSQRARFYGQSVALATVLTRLDAPSKIFEFAAEVERTSPERALRSVYKLDLRELDRRIFELTYATDLAQQP